MFIRFRALQWDALGWWIGSGVMGVAVGFGVGLVIGAAASRLYGGLAEDRVPILEIIGVSVAILQGMVMRKYLGNGGWWALLTAAAWIAGQALTSLVAPRLNWDVVHPEVIAGAVCLMRGALLGAVQWLILRRGIPQARWWIIASAAGWMLMGLVIGKSIDSLGDIVALGALPAIVTGTALAWMLRGGTSPALAA